MQLRALLLFILLFCSYLMHAQVNNHSIKVYLLGTFHFAQTDSAYDVLAPQHQAGISKLCKIIEQQKPDKIFIERMPDFEHQNKMDSLYKAYLAGNTAIRRNEIWQVAFRVAKELGHPAVYSCDHPGQYGYYYAQIEEYAIKHNQAEKLDYKGKGITAPLSYFTNEDSLLAHSEILDYIRWLNSKEVQESSHAHYVNQYPQLGNTDVFHYDEAYFLGAELTADWYRRNIKIYSKMIAQLDYSEQAIFLIMGNDHIPIIKHLFESNPFFEVVDTESWLGKSSIKINQQ